MPFYSPYRLHDEHLNCKQPLLSPYVALIILNSLTHDVNNSPSIKTFKYRYFKIVSSLNIPLISKMKVSRSS